MDGQAVGALLHVLAARRRTGAGQGIRDHLVECPANGTDLRPGSDRAIDGRVDRLGTDARGSEADEGHQRYGSHVWCYTPAAATVPPSVRARFSGTGATDRPIALVIARSSATKRAN